MLALFFFRPAVYVRSYALTVPNLPCVVLFQLQAAGSGGDVHPFEKPFFTAWESAAALCICLPIYWLGLLFSKRPDSTTDEEQPLLTHQVASVHVDYVVCILATKIAVQACAGIGNHTPCPGTPLSEDGLWRRQRPYQRTIESMKAGRHSLSKYLLSVFLDC